MGADLGTFWKKEAIDPFPFTGFTFLIFFTPFLFLVSGGGGLRASFGVGDGGGVGVGVGAVSYTHLTLPTNGTV